ncbi:uncharacterized protein OCT59_024686 [Rhizophagus irregularis]|uniref:Uncharacterized protein n=2 Tax=Rhizophagus irregularis TaxID=588596 RepID=A0A2N1NA64_9GLOM|nr:hypothetical protein RhiirC2_745847 [Rhizophagus irregularis]UZO04295.1 hypothetical protein OCT59_024686 [Rhizophagus irregularis]
MISDKKHSSSNMPSDLEELKKIKKLAKLVGFNEQYSILYSVFSGEIKPLEKNWMTIIPSMKSLKRGQIN